MCCFFNSSVFILSFLHFHRTCCIYQALPVNGCWCHHSLSLLGLMCLLKCLCGYSWCCFPALCPEPENSRSEQWLIVLFYNVCLRKQGFLQTRPNSNTIPFFLFLFFYFSAYARGCRPAAATGGRAWAGPGVPQLQTAGDQPSAEGKNLSDPQTGLCTHTHTHTVWVFLKLRPLICSRGWFLFI